MGRPAPSSYRLEFVDAEHGVRILKFVTTFEEVQTLLNEGHAFEIYAQFDAPVGEYDQRNAVLEEAAAACERQERPTTDLDARAFYAALSQAASAVRALRVDIAPGGHVPRVGGDA